MTTNSDYPTWLSVLNFSAMAWCIFACALDVVEATNGAPAEWALAALMAVCAYINGRLFFKHSL